MKRRTATAAPTPDTRAAAEKALADARSKRLDIDAQLREVEQQLAVRRARFGESVVAGADADELTQDIDRLEGERQRLTELQRANSQLCESIAAALDRDRQDGGLADLATLYDQFVDEARAATVGAFDQIEVDLVRLEALAEKLDEAWGRSQPMDRDDMYLWSWRLSGARNSLHAVRHYLSECERILAPVPLKLT